MLESHGRSELAGNQLGLLHTEALQGGKRSQPEGGNLQVLEGSQKAVHTLAVRMLVVVGILGEGSPPVEGIPVEDNRMLLEGIHVEEDSHLDVQTHSHG